MTGSAVRSASPVTRTLVPPWATWSSVSAGQATGERAVEPSA
ncbi:hypothetical protein PV408_16395 [Streptomyces sp. ME18-1-4]|nr:hypothetical protein [Streptomyces sp. ME18-1-4]MDX3243354.1 hypothetical protein [Streptomyces sp. ME18-1-4]